MLRAEDNTEPPFIEEEGQAPIIPVVGVGVCAASLRSLEALFAGIDASLEAAYLIAVRQREGLNVATVVDVLTRQSRLPVAIAVNGEPLERNHIYVGGPDDMLGVEEGNLNVRPATEPVGHRGTIDTMLISLAEYAHDRSVSVLLSGPGSDGTAGVTATKKFGGLSIAEADARDDQDRPHGGTGPFGVVDICVPADEIPAQIALYLGNLAAASAEPEQEGLDEDIETRVTEITTVL